VGHDVIDRLLGEGMRRLVSEEPAEPGMPEPSLRDVMADEPTWDSVQSTFGAAGGTAKTSAPSRPPQPTPDRRRPTREVEQPVVVAPAVPEPAEASTSEAEETAAPEFSVLLGDSGATGQFGLLGVVAAEEWRRVALDLNGCNTISVFGVQGGGKSYTLGSVLEMAVQRIAGVNLLPRPLAAVVFHYHQTQDYPPEFVSMVHPNGDPAQVQALAKLGAVSTPVPDVVVLTTADTVDRRRKAHKYLGASLIDQVVETIREMRHKGVSVVVASQDPVHVPPAVIELSSAVILHRFNAPSWLRHVQKSLAALGDLTPPMLAALSPGEAFVWANRASSEVFTRRAVKLRMRPRATKHGGSTRLAIED
jgi:hypothetical protein